MGGGAAVDAGRCAGALGGDRRDRQAVARQSRDDRDVPQVGDEGKEAGALHDRGQAGDRIRVDPEHDRGCAGR